MKLEKKRYCMHNLFSLVIERLILNNPSINKEKIIAEFTQSNTYAKLFDEKTRLWAEGPDYILDLYCEEIKFSKNKTNRK